MLVDAMDNSTEPPSERKAFRDYRLQTKAGRCPRALSTDCRPPGTFIASC